LSAHTPTKAKASSEIRYTTKPGIILGEQEIPAQEQGIFPVKSQIINGQSFRYTHGLNLR
jgi:hypothetical protein